MQNWMGYLAAAALVASPLMAKDAPGPTEINVLVDQPIGAVVEGKPARLQITTGLVDRLTLHTNFVAANGIQPAPIAGKANVNFWGRREISGRNRPLDYSIDGVKEKGRAFWFLDVPQPKFDGSVGPWAIPFDRVIVGLSPTSGAEQSFDFPYYGDLNNGSVTLHQDPAFRTSLTFGVERELKYPLASAATGAAIAAAYGGTLSGEEWQEHIAFGVTRPVRLMTLERPFRVGPFAFTQIAVRTRSTRDAAGSGEAIAEAVDAENVDPQEIVVVGLGKKARKPAFTLSIARAALNQCASITFDKAVRKISLSCRPA
jgi:hypothetical protein